MSRRDPDRFDEHEHEVALARHGEPADYLWHEGHVERRGRIQQRDAEWSERRARMWDE